MRASLGGRIYCDFGPNLGLYRYDGSLYLTEAEDAQLTPELASAVGLPAVGAGRFEFRAADCGGPVLACTGCGRTIREDLPGDDLTTLVTEAAGHDCPRDAAEASGLFAWGHDGCPGRFDFHQRGRGATVWACAACGQHRMRPDDPAASRAAMAALAAGLIAAADEIEASDG